MAEYDLHWRLSVLQGNDWFRDLPLPAQQALARISRHRRYLNGELIAAGETAVTFTEENIHRTYETRVFAAVEHGVAI